MSLATAAANRLLEQEPWARERLGDFAGRGVLLRIGPLALACRIDTRGLVERASLADTAPDLVLTLAPLDLPAFLADPRRWTEFVSAEGDAPLAALLQELAQTFPWFVERLCARSLGTFVGLRVADAGRRMLGMPEYVAARVAANVGSYARDETRVLAHPADLRALREETASIGGRVDALAARIEVLSAKAQAANA